LRLQGPAAERLTPRTNGFGFVIGHYELTVDRLYEEYVIVTGPSSIDIPIGSRLRVVPNHSCATANLHERMIVVQDGEVVDVWFIDARDGSETLTGPARSRHFGGASPDPTGHRFFLAFPLRISDS
jgi:hypothetical protein